MWAWLFDSGREDQGKSNRHFHTDELINFSRAFVQLYACISCCKEKLCNIGNGSNYLFVDYRLAFVFLLSIFFKTEQSAWKDTPTIGANFPKRFSFHLVAIETITSFVSISIVNLNQPIFLKSYRTKNNSLQIRNKNLKVSWWTILLA
jgi:hypothetical protein